MINGEKYVVEKGGHIISVDRTWKKGDKLTLTLPMNVVTSNLGEKFKSG